MEKKYQIFFPILEQINFCTRKKKKEEVYVSSNMMMKAFCFTCRVILVKSFEFKSAQIV
jgi:hypothetical protein